jgi:transposase-like protein
MSKRRFTPEQIADLLKTCHITKCSEKAMTYSKEFKVSAVRQYLVDGKSPKDIFLGANFDLSVIGRDTPKECLQNWRRIYKAKGEIGLRTESRGRSGGRPTMKGLTESERIAYLEAEVAYLKAENDFLAKLRAKRAE